MQLSFAFLKQLLLALTTFLKILKLHLHLYLNPDKSAYPVYCCSKKANEGHILLQDSGQNIYHVSVKRYRSAAIAG